MANDRCLPFVLAEEQGLKVADTALLALKKQMVLYRPSEDDSGGLLHMEYADGSLPLEWPSEEASRM